MTDGGWRPIESAPKDGTAILGFGHADWACGAWTAELTASLIRGGTLRRVIMQWVEEDEEDESGHWETVTDNPYKDWVVPTYWMPLPPAPAA